MAPMTRSRWAEYGKRFFRFTFEADFANATAWYDLPPAPLESMSLLMNLCYSGASQVASDAEPIPFRTVLSWLPRAARKERASQPNSGETAGRDNSTLLAEHPYLKRSLAQQVGEGSKNADKTPANTDPAVTEPWATMLCKSCFQRLSAKGTSMLKPQGAMETSWSACWEASGPWNPRVCLSLPSKGRPKIIPQRRTGATSMPCIGP